MIIAVQGNRGCGKSYRAEVLSRNMSKSGYVFGGFPNGASVGVSGVTTYTMKVIRPYAVSGLDGNAKTTSCGISNIPKEILREYDRLKWQGDDE